VERTHRQLRTRFTDTLGGDDPDGHPFFDHGTGRHVHAVAISAKPSGASQVIGERTWIFSKPSSSIRERFPA
jgi:hypothetical protein